MQKDTPHIKKKKRRGIVCGLLFAALYVFLLPSCDSEATETYASTEVQTVKATLCLAVSPFSEQEGGVTRAVAGLEDEDRVRDLWVFQFNMETGSLMAVDNAYKAVYIGPDNLNGIQDIQVDFIQNDPGEHSIVCVVANTHDASWAVDENGNVLDAFKTLTEFRLQALPGGVLEPFRSTNMGENGYTIPMYGESDEMVIAAKSYIRVPLIRMFARVEVVVDPSYPHEYEMSLHEITYRNIPSYCRVAEITDNISYPADQWTKFEEAEDNNPILYLPENIQGKVDGMTSKQKDIEGLAPPRALAIDVRMKHQITIDPDSSHIHHYTVYPGMDMVNDFNVKRNYRYKINIQIKSEPSTDNIEQELP